MRSAQILLTSLVLITSGCTIGIPSNEDPSNSTIRRCDTDADCDDGIVCNVDECSSGVCSNHACNLGDYCDPEGGGCIPIPGDVCLSQCGIGLDPVSSPCPNRPLNEFEDFVTLRNQWLNEEFPGTHLAGRCADGTRFLAEGMGSAITRYYDGTTGQFIAQRLLTDVSDQYCCGVSYWPLFHECEQPIVDEIFSGIEQLIGGMLPPYWTAAPCVDYAVYVDPERTCDNPPIANCVECLTDSDCDDGNFCTIETCNLGQCEFSERMCSDGRSCDQELARCVLTVDRCISQCPPDYFDCNEIPIEDFPDYQTTLENWRSPDFCVVGGAAGVCADGTLFVGRFSGVADEYRFFDAQSGALIALRNGTDADPSGCCGRSFWPFVYRCEQAVVTEVLCGEFDSVGDELSWLALGPCETTALPMPTNPCQLRFYDGMQFVDPSTIDFDDFVTVRANWIDDLTFCEDDTGIPFRAAGTCSDGTAFLTELDGYTIVTDYFDPLTGRFLSRSQQSDGIDESCCGLTYYPELRHCSDATITEVICGTQVQVGQVLSNWGEPPCEEPTTAECITDADCPDDELFCNGPPFCSGTPGRCIYPDGNNVCGFIGPCDETTNSCVNAFDSPLCQLDCDFDPESCVRWPFIETDSFEEVLAHLLGANMDLSCDDYSGIYSGSCATSNLRFLFRSYGLFAFAEFYDNDTGQFVARREWTDLVDDTCFGKSYWPVRVECNDAIVTEAHCGTFWAAGEHVDLADIWP